MTRMKFVTGFKTFHTVILACLLVQLSGCGTLMYPERRGQRSGEIDIKVAVLDGLGLLLFVIPGVVAYVVDFSTGAIYLPHGRKQFVSTDEIRVVRVNPDDLKNTEMIREIVVKQTGLSDRDVDLAKAKLYTVKRPENVYAKLVDLKNSGYRVAQ